MKKIILLFVSAGVLLLAYSCNSGTAEDQGAKAPEQKQANTETKQKAPEKGNKPAADPAATSPEQAEVRKPAQASPSKQEAGPEPFDYLTKLYLSENKRIMVKYNPEHTEIINKEIDGMPESDPYSPIAENMYIGTIALKTKIKPGGADYVVVFSYGPSADPAFMFYKDGEFSQSAFRIAGKNLFIPVNGNLYSEGYASLNVDVRRKYIFSNNNIEEVDQPFYYVGKQTTTKKAFKLYATQQFNREVASLPANYPIEIVLEHTNKRALLIKTKFGLVGWKKVNLRGLQSADIKGLRTASD